MLDVWLRALTRPRLATYEALLEQAEHPSLDQAVKWIVVAVALGTLVLGFWLPWIGTIASVQWAVCTLAMLMWAVVVLVVVLVVFFLIHTCVLLGVSKALGGQGTLKTQSYLLAASWAPMIILASLVAPVAKVAPVAGGLVWGGTVCNAYLQALGLRAAHKYGWGKAALALATSYVCFAILGKLLLLAFPRST